jgi:outer membrane protein TolC
VAKVEAQVVADVAGAFATYQSSRRTARRAEEQVRSLSSNVRESVGSDYAKGTASLIDYLDTERSRIQHEIEYLGTLQTFWTSVFQLERAVGVTFVP